MPILDKLYQANINPLYVNAYNTKDTFDDINRTGEAMASLYAGVTEPDTTEVDYEAKKARVDAYRKNIDTAIEGEGHYKDRYKQALKLQNQYKNDPVLNKMVQSKAEQAAYKKEISDRKDLTGDDAAIYEKIADQKFATTGGTQYDPETKGFKTYSATTVDPAKRVSRVDFLNQYKFHPSGYQVENGSLLEKDPTTGGWKQTLKGSEGQYVARDKVQNLIQTDWDKNTSGIRDSESEQALLELVKLNAGKKGEDGQPIKEADLYDFYKNNPNSALADGQPSLKQAIDNRRSQFINDGMDYLGWNISGSSEKIDYTMPAKGDGKDDDTPEFEEVEVNVKTSKTDKNVGIETYQAGQESVEEIAKKKREDLKTQLAQKKLTQKQYDTALNAINLSEKGTKMIGAIVHYFGKDVLEEGTREWHQAQVWGKRFAETQGKKWESLSKDEKETYIAQAPNELKMATTQRRPKITTKNQLLMDAYDKTYFGEMPAAKEQPTLGLGSQSTFNINGQDLAPTQFTEMVLEGTRPKIVSFNNLTPFNNEPYGSVNITFKNKDGETVNASMSPNTTKEKEEVLDYKIAGKTYSASPYNVNRFYQGAYVNPSGVFHGEAYYPDLGGTVPITVKTDPKNGGLEVTAGNGKKIYIKKLSDNFEENAKLQSIRADAFLHEKLTGQ